MSSGDRPFESRYGLMDRGLHRLAFATRTAQLGVADLEDRRFRQELDAVQPGRPVLITGLPRSGTTILLELLSRLPVFASHLYRDMPFVLCPMTWNSGTRRSQREDLPMERAHGDGIKISLDSPEAFEEMVWMAFHRKDYRGGSIAPLDSCNHPEFVEFFATHRRKIVALRARRNPQARRYLSKNNLNLARLPKALFDAVPDATVVVPFREPVQHAASLLRQHLAFTALHDRDPFSRRYMAGIGHFDFGRNLKPIDFGGWLLDRVGPGPNQLSFWLDYWFAAHSHVLRVVEQPAVVLVSFEELGRAQGLDRLALALDLPGASFDAQASVLREVADRDVETAHVAEDLLQRCAQLYAELLRQSKPSD